MEGWGCPHLQNQDGARILEEEQQKQEQYNSIRECDVLSARALPNTVYWSFRSSGTRLRPWKEGTTGGYSVRHSCENGYTGLWEGLSFVVVYVFNFVLFLFLNDIKPVFAS